MEFTEVVKNRYSCKKYDGKQISEEQLDAVLQAGRLHFHTFHTKFSASFQFRAVQ